MNKSMKIINVLDFAKFLIVYYEQHGIDLTNLKLQKLLYYVQAWVIAKFKIQFYKELPEAWVNGPVYSSVYTQFASFKAKKISVKNEPGIENFFEDNNISNEIQQWIMNILDYYITLSAEKLVYLTHIESPWKEARGSLGVFDKSTEEISFESLLDYYGNRFKKYNNM